MYFDHILLLSSSKFKELTIDHHNYWTLSVHHLCWNEPKEQIVSSSLLQSSLGPLREFARPVANLYLGALWRDYFKQQKEQYSKALRIPLVPYTHPRFDRALLSFWLFLKLRPLVGWEPRTNCSPAPTLPLDDIVIISPEEWVLSTNLYTQNNFFLDDLQDSSSDTNLPRFW